MSAGQEVGLLLNRSLLAISSPMLFLSIKLGGPRLAVAEAAPVDGPQKSRAVARCANQW